MKHLREAVIGVLTVLLLAMPVVAATDATVSDIYAGSVGSGGIGDTQSPVLDGGVFTEYDTIFLHGTMAESVYNAFGVYAEGDLTNCHFITIYPASDGTIVNCPLVSYHSKQGGIQPRVKYLGLEYQTQKSTEIYQVQLFNGVDLIKKIDLTPPFKSTTGELRVIALDGWYLFDHGLGMALFIRNPSPTDYGGVFISGYGARFEW